MLERRLVDIINTEDASGTISPLPEVLVRGLGAVAFFGFLSFFTSVSLFLYLTYKLIVWQTQPLLEKRPASPDQALESPTSDFNGFLVPDSHYCPQKDKMWDEPPEEARPARREPPNQFLVLIYNLLFADIQQALAFLLNVTWLSKNAVAVGTDACWAQGWFISTGDLASSVFIAAIAIHTYLGVVRGYRLPTTVFYSGVALLWTFVYGLAILGVAITNNGEADGGLYVRAGAWCWINGAYQNLRLHLHYLWIFLSLGVTSVVYLVIFFHLRFHSRHSSTCCLSDKNHGTGGAHYPNPDPNGKSPVPSIAPSSPRSSITDTSIKRLPPIPSSARHPTFLLYPLIYVLCTAPLAAGRIASMAGNNVSLAYFCFAGSMIASAGWLDVALYSWTRRSIVFSGEAPPSQDTGLETFAFMRTPASRLGNTVYISGGSPGGKRRRWAGWNDKLVASAKLKTLRSGGNSRNGSKETVSSMKGFGMGAGEVMGMAINIETTIVVEDTVEDGLGISRSGSVNSSLSKSAKGPRV